MVIISLMSTGCMSTTNGLVYKDGWKGRNVNEFIQHWESKGYRCGKRETVVLTTGEPTGIASCNQTSTAFVCPKYLSKTVSYNLLGGGIKGRVAERSQLGCF